MTRLILGAAALALAAPAAAQDAHAGHGDHAAHAAAAARLTLDTPVETIVADPAGKAVLDSNLPGMTTHEHYPMFKAYNLRQIAAYAPDRIPAEALTKIEAELAAIK